jgi:hypothetical protein
MAVAAVVVSAGCGAHAVQLADGGTGSPPELGSSLNVRVVEDTVVLELHVTNVTAGPITLEFMTTQRYDFQVSTRTGESVWSWSADRSFGEALGQETLQPGDSQRYTTTWWSGGHEGEFVATGRIVSTNYPVELTTGFRLP